MVISPAVFRRLCRARVMFATPEADGDPAPFESSDVAAEYERLAARGVAFTRAPTKAGPVTIAVFSDTCGNLIQIYQRT